jgi:hypothetical protein
MADEAPVTKSDVREIVREVSDRIIALLQANMERMDQRFNELDARFDNQSTRLERQGALLQTGSR